MRLVCFMSVRHMCITIVYRDQKTVADFLKQVLQTVVSHYVGAGKHNLGPMQEQQVFLCTEPALQTFHFKIK